MKRKHTDSNSSPGKSAKQILDLQAKDLSIRHQARLQQMTDDAVALFRSHVPEKIPGQRNHAATLRRFAPPAALVAAVLLMVWIWWPLGQSSRTQIETAESKIRPPAAMPPEWVLDTSVPISLLQNQAFYDWLAKQPDGQKHG